VKKGKKKRKWKKSETVRKLVGKKDVIWKWVKRKAWIESKCEDIDKGEVTQT
jgi:hypothetical protein